MLANGWMRPVFYTSLFSLFFTSRFTGPSAKVNNSCHFMRTGSWRGSPQHSWPLYLSEWPLSLWRCWTNAINNVLWKTWFEFSPGRSHLWTFTAWNQLARWNRKKRKSHKMSNQWMQRYFSSAYCIIQLQMWQAKMKDANLIQEGVACWD